MKKEELLKLPELILLDSVKAAAMEDVPKKMKVSNGQIIDSYKIVACMRCQVFDGILKAAFYLTRDIQMESVKPIYEIFIDKEKQTFITWDVLYKRWRKAKLDRLEWPYCQYGSRIFCSEEDCLCIKNYLGTKEGGPKGLLAYQYDIREKELIRRHKKETDAWDNALSKTSDVPDDWMTWVDTNGIRQNYIFYDYTRRMKKTGYCTWCKKEVPVTNPKHNQEGVCQSCGHKVQYKARGRAGCFHTDDHTMYLLQAYGDGIIIRQYNARRWYKKGYFEELKIQVSEERRIIYDSNLDVQAFYYGLYKQKEVRWIKGNPINTSYYLWNYRSYYGAVYQGNMNELAKGLLGRTGLIELMGYKKELDPEHYMEVLRKKPVLEKLVKSGLSVLADEVLQGKETIKVQEATELAKTLKIDKFRLGRLRAHNGGGRFLKWLQHEKMNQKTLSDELIRFFVDERIEPADLDFILDRMSESRIYHYIHKHVLMGRRSFKELLSTWQDYLFMAEHLKMDVKKELIFKPKNLIEAHDEAVRLSGGKEVAVRSDEIRKLYPNVESVYHSIKEKYEYQDEEFQILVPDRIEDIVMEGRTLRHCLDKSDIYFDRIQRNESYIFFLRRSDSPEKPFYTLEVEPGGTARQKRTTGDKQNADFEDAKRFILKWQGEVQKRLTTEDVELAKRSEILRIEEFKELRKNKNVIWHGHLVGKLLVDVLEDDLMIAGANALCHINEHNAFLVAA